MRYAIFSLIVLASCGGGPEPSPYELVERRCGFTRYDLDLDDYVYCPPMTFEADPDLGVRVTLWDGRVYTGEIADAIDYQWWEWNIPEAVCALDEPQDYIDAGWLVWDWPAGRPVSAV